jgi:hypothetical protein
VSLQRWSVAEIDAERDRLKPRFGGAAALHHIVSRDTMSAIALEVGTMSGYSGQKARDWRDTKAASSAFKSAVQAAWNGSIRGPARAQTGGNLERTLHNLPFNLEAGPEDPIGDPGTGVDVNTTSRVGGAGEEIREVEPVSAQMAGLYEHWRNYRFQRRLSEDAGCAAALNGMTTALSEAARLHATVGMKNPIVNQWFAHGNDQSRKREGTYHGTERGTEKFRAAQADPEAIPDETIESTDKALHRKKNGEDKQLNLTVRVGPDALEHIYKRHTYLHFDFDDIKLVNSFFPYAGASAINAAIELLTEELIEYLKVEIGATNWEELDGQVKTYVTPTIFALGRFDGEADDNAEEVGDDYDYFDDDVHTLVFTVNTFAPQSGDNYTSTELTAIKAELVEEEEE